MFSRPRPCQHSRISLFRIAFASLLAIGSTVSAKQATTPDRSHAIAEEAVAEAIKLPPGYKRDIVLRAVSRNLRWFGQPVAGMKAARAMTDLGVTEVPLGAQPRPPRFVPLREVFPSGNCDAGVWRKEDGGEAKSPKAREDWAEECLLTRDFHYIGRPEVALVKTVATGLRMGEIKARVLAMLVRSYGQADSLRFVAGEMERDGDALPAKSRAALAAMLAEPESLYRLGRKDEALVAARVTTRFQAKAGLIELLLRENDPGGAMIVFETLATTPPEFAEDCDGWFSPLGGLRLSYLGYPMQPSTGLGGLLDLLPGSAFFRKVCPNGLEAETAVGFLLAAGRLDAAIVRARGVENQPFLLVSAALSAGEARLITGERDAARANAIEAGAALPEFDPGDSVSPVVSDGMSVMTSTNVVGGPSRNYGELSGNTHRRFEVVRLLAATGAVAEAIALAREQPAGALRAVALSAASAGLAGLRFGDQVPILSGIERSDL
ncbi:hypothetical protein [uncultured Sphingomonas sp.]|uniref:hypothetical protein n=1 Tax=uncultured Sphingomonas sp. TaxID=158754 RepID=UPI0035CC1827